jgi:hypothetical protein
VSILMRLLVLSSNSVMASPVVLFEAEGELLGSGITGFTIWMALEGTGMADIGSTKQGIPLIATQKMDAAAVAARSISNKRSNAQATAKLDSAAQDSPAYDASDEDASDRTEGDPLSSIHGQPSRPIPRPRQSKGLSHASHLTNVDSDTGTDSPTYDGDIESSTNTVKQAVHHRSLLSISSTDADGSPTGTPIMTPSASSATLHPPKPDDVNLLHVPSVHALSEPSGASGTSTNFNPASLTIEDIQAFVKRAIDGESHRKYKINQPPTGRPVRVYADGK